jgi:hypothetical protein
MKVQHTGDLSAVRGADVPTVTVTLLFRDETLEMAVKFAALSTVGVERHTEQNGWLLLLPSYLHSFI